MKKIKQEMQKEEVETEKEIIGECFCDAVGQHMMDIFLSIYQNFIQEFLLEKFSDNKCPM